MPLEKSPTKIQEITENVIKWATILTPAKIGKDPIGTDLPLQQEREFQTGLQLRVMERVELIMGDGLKENIQLKKDKLLEPLLASQVANLTSVNMAERCLFGTAEPSSFIT